MSCQKKYVCWKEDVKRKNWGSPEDEDNGRVLALKKNNVIGLETNMEYTVDFNLVDCKIRLRYCFCRS